MARTLDREPTFQPVKVAPTHSPPASAVRSTRPVLQTDRPASYPVYTIFRFAWYRLICCQASVHQQIAY